MSAFQAGKEYGNPGQQDPTYFTVGSLLSQSLQHVLVGQRVQRIVQDSGMPYFCFKDVDENKPTRSVRLRVDTIIYSLERYRQDVLLRPRGSGRSAASTAR